MLAVFQTYIHTIEQEIHDYEQKLEAKRQEISQLQGLQGQVLKAFETLKATLYKAKDIDHNACMAIKKATLSLFDNWILGQDEAEITLPDSPSPSPTVEVPAEKIEAVSQQEDDGIVYHHNSLFIGIANKRRAEKWGNYVCFGAYKATRFQVESPTKISGFKYELMIENIDSESAKALMNCDFSKNPEFPNNAPWENCSEPPTVNKSEVKPPAPPVDVQESPEQKTQNVTPTPSPVPQEQPTQTKFEIGDTVKTGAGFRYRILELSQDGRTARLLTEDKETIRLSLHELTLVHKATDYDLAVIKEFSNKPKTLGFTLNQQVKVISDKIPELIGKIGKVVSSRSIHPDKAYVEFDSDQPPKVFKNHELLLVS